MSWTLVQQTNEVSFLTGTPTLTTGVAVTKGNLLIAWTTSSSATFQTINDSHNFWVPIKALQAGGYGKISAWYAIAKRSEILSVQFFDANPVGGSTPSNLNSTNSQLMEWSGNASVPFDASGTFATGTSTAPAASVTTAAANELVLGFGIAGSTSNADTIVETAGWTNTISALSPYAAIYQVPGSSGASTPTFLQNNSAAWGCFAAAFKPSTITTYTIAGALGSAGAGAQVLFTSATTTVVYTATANGSGAYTSPALAPDTYIVQAQLVGQVFSPQSSNVAVTSANVTGTNFTASQVLTTVSFYQVTADPLNGANVNPINATNWPADNVPSGGAIPPWDPTFQTLSGECTFDNLSILSNYTGPWSAGGMTTNHAATYTADQFSQFQLNSLNFAPLSWATFQLGVRCSTDCTSGEYAGIFNNGDGTCQIICGNIWANDPSTGRPSGTGNCVPPSPAPAGIKSWGPGFLNLLSVPFSFGDKFALAAIGTTYYVIHNGVVIGNYIDTAPLPQPQFSSSPYPSMVAYGNAYTDVQFSNFTGGTAYITPQAPLVQEFHIYGVGAGPSTSLLVSKIPVTHGNLLVTWCSSYTGFSPSAPTDTLTNTWIQVGTTLTASYGYITMYYAIANGSGNTTITWANVDFQYCQAVEVKSTSAALDHHTQTSGSTTGPATNSVATTNPNEFVIACGISPSAQMLITTGTPWLAADGFNTSTLGAIFQVGATATTYSPSYTLSGGTGWGIISASFSGTFLTNSIPVVCVME